jgi:hypothetical protein
VHAPRMDGQISRGRVGTTYKVDARTGKKVRFGGTPKYQPDVAQPKTRGQKAYLVTVDSNQVTVTRRKTGGLVASFTAPGVGGSWDWSSGASLISPDGRYVAFENYAMPYDDSRAEYQVWVCKLNGTRARQMKFGNGSFAWR